jgi:two-component system cell cycle sensor histidine kinase/response regulator CckA
MKSGYAQPVLTSNGILDPGVHLLEKPFTGTGLLNAVSDQLTAAAPLSDAPL